MQFTIRPADTTDRDVIVDFNRRLATETEDKSLDHETLVAGVDTLLAKPAFGQYFLAERDGIVIGQLMVTYEWSDWRNGLFWWLQSVYVHPDCRRRGVFDALYQHVRTLAERDTGVCGVRLYVERGNERARQVYRRLGFEKTTYRVMETEF